MSAFASFRGSNRTAEDPDVPITVEYSPFLRFLDNLTLEAINPREWEAILIEQREIIRSQNRHNRSHPHAGFLDKREEDLNFYYKHLPLMVGILSAGVFAFLRMQPAASEMIPGIAGLLAPGRFVAEMVTAILGGAVVGVIAGRVRWFFDFGEVFLIPKMKEARRRNHQRIKVELYERRRSYLAYAMNESPKVGPIHFARMRLLSRLYWDLIYFVDLDYVLFRYGIVDEGFPEESWKIRTVLCAGLVGLLGSFLLVSGNGEVAQVENFVTFSGALTAGAIGWWIVFAIFKRSVTNIVDFQKTIVKPNLSVEDCNRLDINTDRVYEWNWKERSEYDDTQVYAEWLEEQLETLRKLKENDFVLPGAPAAPPGASMMRRDED